MKMENQLNNRNQINEHSSLNTSMCERENCSLLRNLATKLLLSTGIFGAGFGSLEARAAREVPPVPSLNRTLDNISFPTKIVMLSPLKPLKTSIESKACAQATTLFSEKGVCFVHDIIENKAVVRISIAVGVNINGGTLIIGGGVKSVFEVTLDFPVGTNKEDAMKVAKEEVEKLLLEKEAKEKIAKLGGTYKVVSKVTDVKDRSKDGSWIESFKKALKDAPKDKPYY